jgi:hypothetical protein
MKGKITDYIYSSKSNKDYALVKVYKNPGNEFEFIGEININKFPPELLALIKEYHDALDKMMFPVVEGIEDKIFSYDLKLKQSNIPIYCLSIDNEKISFFSQYPTANGYLNERPQNSIL